jgi:hypothetical protein
VSRILFAWELGGGFGHLGPFRPVAEALLARGHELTLAVREVERANIVFSSMAVRIVQAPLCVKTYNGLAEPPLNYAEILMRYGYLDAPLLAGLLNAWSGLLDLSRADILVADHAPTALLAARGRGRARAVFGGAFAVPTRATPSPNMRPWVNVPQQRLASSDASVLRVINASLLPGTPGLSALHEIFDGANYFLNGVPELDPYGPRDRGCYLGLHAGLIGASPPRWPEGEGPRVFAYLRSDYRHIEAALAALATGGVRSVVHLQGASPQIRQKYQGPQLVFSEDLLDLERAVGSSDLCVGHGSGTVMGVLRGGKPMLLLPVQLENFLLSSSIERLGIARVVHPEAEPPDIGGALANMLANVSSFADAALAFALKHREPSVDTIVERAAGRIEALAQGQPV